MEISAPSDCEVRTVIKFLDAEGVPGSEIHRRLSNLGGRWPQKVHVSWLRMKTILLTFFDSNLIIIWNSSSRGPQWWLCFTVMLWSNENIFRNYTRDDGISFFTGATCKVEAYGHKEIQNRNLQTEITVSLPLCPLRLYFTCCNSKEGGWSSLA